MLGSQGDMDKIRAYRSQAPLRRTLSLARREIAVKPPPFTPMLPSIRSPPLIPSPHTTLLPVELIRSIFTLAARSSPSTAAAICAVSRAMRKLAEPLLYRVLAFRAPAQIHAFCTARTYARGACSRLAAYVRALWAGARPPPHLRAEAERVREYLLMSPRMGAVLSRLERLAVDLDVLYYLSHNLVGARAPVSELVLLRAHAPVLDVGTPHTTAFMRELCGQLRRVHVRAQDVGLVLGDTAHPALCFRGLTHLAVYMRRPADPSGNSMQTYDNTLRVPVPVLLEKLRGAIRTLEHLEMLVIMFDDYDASRPYVELEDLAIRRQSWRAPLTWWDQWCMLQEFGVEEAQRPREEGGGRVYVLPYCRSMEEEWEDMVWGEESVWARAKKSGRPRVPLKKTQKKDTAGKDARA